MTSLSQLQALLQSYVLNGDERLLEHIASPSGADDPKRRAEIYSEAYRLRLREALASNYPRLEQLIGSAAFVLLADAYIDTHVSHHRSIRWYGEHLAALLARKHPHQPWLQELAQWEWALASAFDAADAAPISIEHVQHLAPDAWPSIRLQFHPSLRRLRLHTNAPLLFKALSDDLPVPQAGATDPTDWLLWRRHLTAHYRSMSPAEAEGLRTMHEGGTFAEMCTKLCDWHSPDDAAVQAAQLFRMWLDDGLVCKVLLAAHTCER